MVCCRFYLTAAPFAANPSGAVRPTDVMVNVIIGCLFEILYYLKFRLCGGLKSGFNYPDFY
ncbi:hypothetical protein JQ91_004715 [Salmonella enterica subsp. enterica]|nr:hypothetical protein [Salmonella enterica subsp. enterica]EDR2559977.1 hypothetical protein [Salmonella enterica subsp. enterica]EDR2619716.1 hypothetical protein [Salmonella enterica subsp. enterica]